MIPKLSCRKCNSEIGPSEKFCSNCGTVIEWSSSASEETHGQQQSASFSTESMETTCPLCGQRNYSNASSCATCGAALGSHAVSTFPKKNSNRKVETTPLQGHPLNPLQSWKVTASVAILLVIILTVVRFTNRDDLPAGISPKAQTVIKEIESLQEAIQANPKNEQALLRLANLYYDMKLFARAIMMYDRYLEMNPSNPDARVDLGISYFEMALVDSASRDQYLTTAKNEIKKALTYNPRHQLAQYNLGMVSLHSGEYEEANDWFRKCAEIDSVSETGRRALQLIKQHSFTNPS